MQNKTTNIRKLTGTAMLGAVAAVLMYMEFPIPIMPSFVKLDVSELPALLAAKTGTAETGNGDRANAWAVGFAPADNPRIAFAVLVESDDTNPTPHGGDVAGPIARAILEAGLS